MSEASMITLREFFKKRHEDDERQLNVIFSKEQRIIVESPAGYGKTTTMVSRIAYLFADGKIPNPKKALVLTFSVNAALKIKRDIAEKLPELMKIQNNPESISSKVTATNYHGFCKTVLKKYGYLLTPILRKDVNLFKAIGDEETKKREDINRILSTEEVTLCEEVSEIIKKGQLPDDKTRAEYLQLITEKLLPIDIITHNAVILYTLALFAKNMEVKNFYQNYYPLLIVDEFQDTNAIAWELLKVVISDKTQLLFLGDSLQRIYGFIGALPNIMNIAKDEYKMHKIILEQNYRFRNNPEMLKLDKNIRRNAATSFQGVSNDDVASVPAAWGCTQQEEASLIAAKIEALRKDYPSERIAILCRSRGKNVAEIEKALVNCKIDYFYGLFNDEDDDYIDFHIKCQDAFMKRFGKEQSVNKRELSNFLGDIQDIYDDRGNKATQSMLELLSALIKKISVDYALISPKDKYLLLLDIFENRQLKQAMEYVRANVILSTIHGAKGLEWEYVFLPDIEQWVFPASSICKQCNNKCTTPKASRYRCVYSVEGNGLSVESFAEELSVFYVGVTRARKQVFVSASAERINSYGQIKDSGFSCLVNLNGIKIENIWDTSNVI